MSARRILAVLALLSLALVGCDSVMHPEDKSGPSWWKGYREQMQQAKVPPEDWNDQAGVVKLTNRLCGYDDLRQSVHQMVQGLDPSTQVHATNMGIAIGAAMNRVCPSRTEPFNRYWTNETFVPPS